MKKTTLTTILLAISVLASAQSIQKGYQNPIIPGCHPDPSICRVGNDYYLVNSSFQYFPGVPLFQSRDLVHWTQVGNVLTRSSQLNLQGATFSSGIYAPTIRYDAGTFYMITTNVSDKGNFLVYTDDPKGEWSEPVWLEQGGIDPSLYFEDGVCYMVSNPEDGISLCTIDPKSGERLSESRRIWGGLGGRYPESPHIYKKDGWYYLMIAEGGTEIGHSVTIARSRDIYGPYEANPANPILTHFCQRGQKSPIQGLGHADMVQAQDGSWWLVCLGFRMENGHHVMGRETFLVPVDWPEGEWPKAGDGGLVYLDNPEVKTLPQKSYPDKPKNLLITKEFGPEWMWLNNPRMENYHFMSSGALRLVPTTVTLDDATSPTFIAHRQEHQAFSLETEVQMDSKAMSELEAGLTVYMCPQAHADLFLKKYPSTQLGYSPVAVTLQYTLYGLKHVEQEMILSSNSARLKVEATATGYDFYCADAGKSYEYLGHLDMRFLSSETAGGFTGVVLGMYAVTTAPASTSYADFKSFIYQSR